MSDLQLLFTQALYTDVTKTIHREPYPVVLPSRPELSQAGRAVLITGGGTGVGYAIARAFVRAAADTVPIIGRRPDVLATASSHLEQEAKASGTNTKILTRTCDVVRLAEVEELWTDLAAQGIAVDVLVANAAKFTATKPILELGADEVWAQVEVNAKAPLYFTEKFYLQQGEKQKFLVNVSTQAIHMTSHPELIAQNIPPEKMQVISFHPGLIYGDGWKSMGLPPDPFDNGKILCINCSFTVAVNADNLYLVDLDELCGGFAVWATAKEAAFLHGRFVWASWDVEELSTGKIRKRIDEDPYYLRASIVGLNGALRA
ncbi:hypothetical protein B7463_g3263, partial [Scytalidium lignicola]